MFGVRRKIKEFTEDVKKNADEQEVIHAAPRIAALLKLQAAFLEDECGSLPATAKDAWSLGYISGFCEAYLEAGKYKKSLFEPTIEAVLYMLFCGVDDFARKNRYFISLKTHRSAGDTCTLEGREHGISEFRAVTEGRRSFSIGWFSHVQNT